MAMALLDDDAPATVRAFALQLMGAAHVTAAAALAMAIAVAAVGGGSLGGLVILLGVVLAVLAVLGVFAFRRIHRGDLPSIVLWEVIFGALVALGLPVIGPWFAATAAVAIVLALSVRLARR